MVVIAVSGWHGTGKSTVARELSRRFGLAYICAGDIFRKMARERGMSLEEFNRYAETHPEIDREIDMRVVEEARKGNSVVDSRLAGWLVPADLKILLTAPLEVRVSRICKRENRDFEEVLRETKTREESEEKRFREMYGIDVNDVSPFDVVLNTAKFSEEEVKEIIALVVEEFLR